MKISVAYPASLQPYRRILCPDQLNRQLETREIGLESPYQHRMKMKGRKFVDFTCRGSFCTAFLKYQLNEDSFYELTEACNIHNHQINEKLFSAELKNTVKGSSYVMNNLFVTKEMLIYYKKYHRCMYLTITKAKNCFMLAFSCALPNKDIAMFAIALYEKPKKYYIRQNLKQFVSRKKQLPETIICNNQQLREIAQQLFPATTFIMIDQEISQNYKVRYGFTKLTEIVTSETDWDKEHRKLVTYLRENVSPAEICNIFENYKKLCFPFLPLTFVGLGVQLFQPLILEQTSEENIFFTNDPSKFLTNFPHKIKTQFHDTECKNFIQQIGMTSDNLLLGVYTELEESIVKFLVSQQNKTFFCDLMALPSGQFQVRYKLTKVCIIKKKDKKWECDCGLDIKSGLPCCHIMKVLLTFEEDIRPYISSYWLPVRQQQNSKV